MCLGEFNLYFAFFIPHTQRASDFVVVSFVENSDLNHNLNLMLLKDKLTYFSYNIHRTKLCFSNISVPYYLIFEILDPTLSNLYDTIWGRDKNIWIRYSGAEI